MRRPDGPGHRSIRAVEPPLLESPTSAGSWQSKAEFVACQRAGGLYLCNWKWGPADRSSQANKALSYWKGKFALFWMLAGGGGGRGRADCSPKPDRMKAAWLLEVSREGSLPLLSPHQ